MGVSIIFHDDAQTTILDRSYEEVMNGIHQAILTDVFFEYVHNGLKFSINPQHIRQVREKG